MYVHVVDVIAVIIKNTVDISLELFNHPLIKLNLNMFPYSHTF